MGTLHVLVAILKKAPVTLHNDLSARCRLQHSNIIQVKRSVYHLSKCNILHKSYWETITAGTYLLVSFWQHHSGLTKLDKTQLRACSLTISFFLTQSMSSMKSFSACSTVYWKIFCMVMISWSRRLSGMVLHITPVSSSHQFTCSWRNLCWGRGGGGGMTKKVLLPSWRTHWVHQSPLELNLIFGPQC